MFFFQAEDGIRDIGVTGVQTCALPISGLLAPRDRGAAAFRARRLLRPDPPGGAALRQRPVHPALAPAAGRSVRTRHRGPNTGGMRGAHHAPLNAGTRAPAAGAPRKRTSTHSRPTNTPNSVFGLCFK